MVRGAATSPGHVLKFWEPSCWDPWCHSWGKKAWQCLGQAHCSALERRRGEILYLFTFVLVINDHTVPLALFALFPINLAYSSYLPSNEWAWHLAVTTPSRLHKLEIASDHLPSSVFRFTLLPLDTPVTLTRYVWQEQPTGRECFQKPHQSSLLRFLLGEGAKKKHKKN